MIGGPKAARSNTHESDKNPHSTNAHRTRLHSDNRSHAVTGISDPIMRLLQPRMESHMQTGRAPCCRRQPFFKVRLGIQGEQRPGTWGSRNKWLPVHTSAVSLLDVAARRLTGRSAISPRPTLVGAVFIVCAREFNYRILAVRRTLQNAAL